MKMIDKMVVRPVLVVLVLLMSLAVGAGEQSGNLLSISINQFELSFPPPLGVTLPIEYRYGTGSRRGMIGVSVTGGARGCNWMGGWANAFFGENYSSTEVYGIFTGLSCRAKEMYGLQLAADNAAEEGDGLQIALSNSISGGASSNVVQIGGWNNNAGSGGFLWQIGGFNRSGGRALQIGLLNIRPNSFCPYLPLIRLWF